MLYSPCDTLGWEITINNGNYYHGQIILHNIFHQILKLLETDLIKYLRKWLLMLFYIYILSIFIESIWIMVCIWNWVHTCVQTGPIEPASKHFHAHLVQTTKTYILHFMLMFLVISNLFLSFLCRQALPWLISHLKLYIYVERSLPLSLSFWSYCDEWQLDCDNWTVTIESDNFSPPFHCQWLHMRLIAINDIKPQHYNFKSKTSVAQIWNMHFDVFVWMCNEVL